MPFLLIPSSTIIAYLRSNIAKFGFGFENSLVRDNGNIISPESSQMALMFLAMLKTCYRGYPLERESGIWMDLGKRRVGKVRKEGIGLIHTLPKYGHGFIKEGKICWDAWQFHAKLKDKILFGFSYNKDIPRKSYKKLIEVTSFDRNCHQLLAWLDKEIQRVENFNTILYQSFQIIWK